MHARHRRSAERTFVAIIRPWAGLDAAPLVALATAQTRPTIQRSLIRGERVCSRLARQLPTIAAIDRQGWACHPRPGSIAHRRNDIKNLFAPALGVAAALATGVASAQSGSMMNGGHWGGGWMGGYGGVWVPVLLVVVVGLVAWIVMQKRK
jgi:hypothetical protein